MQKKEKHLLPTIKHYLTRKERHNYIRSNILYIHIFLVITRTCAKRERAKAFVGARRWRFFTRRQYFYNLSCFARAKRSTRTRPTFRHIGRGNSGRKISESDLRCWTLPVRDAVYRRTLAGSIYSSEWSVQQCARSKRIPACCFPELHSEQFANL